MSLINTLLSYGTTILSSFAFLILSAIGLAVIFGMMGIINLAHGEFILLGVYGTAVSHNAIGLPLVAAMFVGALVPSVVGLILERTVVQHLYTRPTDSMVATWGVSLITIEGLLVLFGPSYPGIQRPFGPVRVGSFSAPIYTFVLVGLAVGILLFTYYVFMYTEFGLRARATLQNEEAARSLGVDTRDIYTKTFVLGSFLAGIAGALYAPVVSIQPNAGSQFVIAAFVTVIVGGTNVLLGTFMSGSTLSIIEGIAAQLVGTFTGRALLLIAAILVIRIAPQGMSTFISEHE
jgi:branched-chain amino acid transport system permease protein